MHYLYGVSIEAIDLSPGYKDVSVFFILFDYCLTELRQYKRITSSYKTLSRRVLTLLFSKSDIKNI